MAQEKMVGQKKEGLSRRKFIASAGTFAVGAAAAGGVLGAVKPSKAATPVNVKVNGKLVQSDVPAQIQDGRTLVPVRFVSQELGAKVDWDQATKTVLIEGEKAQVAPAWPWPYQKLDPEVVRKRGYENYFKGGCMFGAAAALILTLQEEVGYPYNLIPIDMFKYGAGGGVGWGTLCGALNGAGAVMNMVCKDYSKIYNDLMGWYTEFPFPSDKHEAYCKFKNQVTSVSKSPLCHASVSHWAKVAGAKINSDEKKDRCAKLTGDTAAKAVELLNALVDGTFIAAYKPSDEFSHCLGCHVGKDSMLDSVQGKMNCVSCHDDHTK